MSRVRQNNATGKSLLIYGNRVKPQNKKYFAFPEGQIRAHLWTSRPGTRGASRSSLARDGERWTRKCLDERHGSVRQRRVVLTPRCWRQVGGSSPAGDGGKKADHQGERAISRKAIAQGMSDALRCPVCSCAHFLCTLRMRPRVQRAPGIPCALFNFEGEEYLQTSGATRRGIAKSCFPSLRAKRSNPSRRTKKEWIASSLLFLAMTGSPGRLTRLQDGQRHLRRAHHRSADCG